MRQEAAFGGLGVFVGGLDKFKKEKMGEKDVKESEILSPCVDTGHLLVVAGNALRTGKRNRSGRALGG